MADTETEAGQTDTAKTADTETKVPNDQGNIDGTTTGTVNHTVGDDNGGVIPQASISQAAAPQADANASTHHDDGVRDPNAGGAAPTLEAAQASGAPVSADAPPREITQADLLAVAHEINSRLFPGVAPSVNTVTQPDGVVNNVFHDGLANEKKTDAVGSRFDISGQPLVSATPWGEQVIDGPGKPVYVGTALNNNPITGKPAGPMLAAPASTAIDPAASGWTKSV